MIRSREGKNENKSWTKFALKNRKLVQTPLKVSSKMRFRPTHFFLLYYSKLKENATSFWLPIDIKK